MTFKSRPSPTLRLAFSSTLVALALSVPVLKAAQNEPPPAAQSTPQTDDFIQRIDASAHARIDNLAAYKVKEHYAMYRNGEKSASAEETVQTVYTQGAGKQYTPLSHSGSDFLRHTVIDKILANEHEMTVSVSRSSYWVTSSNYVMRVEPGSVTINGRECVLVNLKSRRKSPYLFDGKAWFDATDATLVRVEGTPSQSPSFFAGETTISRDYARIQGFAMATVAKATSHSFLLGNTLLQIDYYDYELRAVSPNPSPAMAETAPSNHP